LAPAELVAFALANAPQTSSAPQRCRYRSAGIPKNARAALPKIDIRYENCRIYLNIIYKIKYDSGGAGGSAGLAEGSFGLG